MRLRLVLTLLLMFPKAVSCWPCRRFWRAGFCVILANTFDCLRAFVAYRAETAMAQILRQNMTRHDDARSLLRAIYSTEVDIVPDPQANTLTIRLHPLANTSSDLAVRHLCAELNTTETLFPGVALSAE